MTLVFLAECDCQKVLFYGPVNLAHFRTPRNLVSYNTFLQCCPISQDTNNLSGRKKKRDFFFKLPKQNIYGAKILENIYKKKPTQTPSFRKLPYHYDFGILMNQTDLIHTSTFHRSRGLHVHTIIFFFTKMLSSVYC